MLINVDLICSQQTARRLHLHHHPECKGLSGGQAIEKLASRDGADITLFHHQNTGGFKERDCNFNFSGMKEIAKQFITKQEIKEGKRNFFYLIF